MLHRTMNNDIPVADRLELEDLLALLRHARRTENLGRLAHVAYWDVRRWAGRARQFTLAERASELVLRQPQPSRAAFLEVVDGVIDELECLRRGLHQPADIRVDGRLARAG